MSSRDPYTAARELGRRAGERGDGAACNPYDAPALRSRWEDARRHAARRRRQAARSHLIELEGHP